MKRTWKHTVNRWFRRRGGLPRSARVPQGGSSPAWRQTHPPSRAGAFARPRFGRDDTLANARRWVKMAALGALVIGMLWVGWQSWVGLGIFNN